MAKIRRLVWMSLVVGALAACTAPTPRPGPAGAPTQTGSAVPPVEAGPICPASTRRDGVVYCTALFPGDRPLRLPADPSAGKRYGAVRRDTTFHTGGGDVPIADALRDELGTAVTDARRKHAGYANTVYLATIVNGKVTAVEPVAVIDEDALLTAVFAGRAMEGTISARTAPDAYSFTETLPVRLEFGPNPAGGKLAGRIVNATAGTRGAGGGCIAPLAGTKGDPLTGSHTAELQIERVPSMHAGFNDELVLLWSPGGSVMGPEFYPSVATLLGGDPLQGEWSTSTHGVPGGAPEVVLRQVTGGGGAC